MGILYELLFRGCEGVWCPKKYGIIKRRSHFNSSQRDNSSGILDRMYQSSECMCVEGKTSSDQVRGGGGGGMQIFKR